MSLLQNSSFCYMFVCCQIFVGISLAELFASATVQHEIHAMFVKAQQVWYWKSWGRNRKAKDHFQVAIVRFLYCSELWVVRTVTGVLSSWILS